MPVYADVVIGTAIGIAIDRDGAKEIEIQIEIGIVDGDRDKDR